VTPAVSLAHYGELEISVWPVILVYTWAGPVSKQMKHLTIWYDCAWHMVWCEGQVNLFLHHDLLLSSVR